MRFENWAEKLSEFLDKPHSFDWISRNCVFFTADAVCVQTGVDYAADYRRIKTKKAMFARLKREYNGDLGTAAKAKLGKPINVTMAKRGDVVQCPIKGINSLGICIGKMSVFISENEGLIYIYTLRCKRAWAI